MPSEADPVVTLFVRYRVIGIDNRKVKAFAEKWGVSKATVTDIRKGKQGIGGEVLLKIADTAFEGDLNRLREEAKVFARENPDLVDPSIPLLERAVGHLAVRELPMAQAYAAAFDEAHAAVEKPNTLTLEAAIDLIRKKVATPASSRRPSGTEPDPPTGSDLQDGNQRRLKRRKSRG